MDNEPIVDMEKLWANIFGWHEMTHEHSGLGFLFMYWIHWELRITQEWESVERSVMEWDPHIQPSIREFHYVIDDEFIN